MELSFVVTAVRRYWWITLICIVVGTMAGLNLRGEAVEEYSSTSLILVSAPTAPAANTFSSGGDRYVQGELSVLQSTSLAESVATDVGQGLTADDVVELVEISQIISTDVINITVTTPDPALAEDIAESYVDEYFDALRAQVNDAQADDIEQLTAQLEGIERDSAPSTTTSKRCSRTCCRACRPIPTRTCSSPTCRSCGPTSRPAG
ncbi:MAG: hypothetical protein R2713_06945 [Ilumatobacteraceae bacterium]